MQNITFFLCEQMLVTSTSLPMEMLRAAQNAARAKDRNALTLSIHTVTLDKNPINTGSGFNLCADHTLAENKKSNIIFLPALWRNPKRSLLKNKQLLDWLHFHHKQGAIICSVGTGVCFLAEAGLLDDNPATTHWYYFDRFARDYPNVQLKRQYFIVQADNLYSAASVNSLADLTIHLIQRLYNQRIATHVERHFSHEIRRSYKSTSFIENNNLHPDESIMQAQVWLQNNFTKEVKLSAVAKNFEMSIRSFNRRFKVAMDMTPLMYLQKIRIDHAKELLKSTDLSIHEITEEVGYQDLAHLNRLFKRILNTSPKQYRAMVRAKLFSP